MSGQCRGSIWKPNPIGACVAGSIDEVDGIDAVAFCIIKGVIEDREPAEVGVFSDFIGGVIKLGNVEARHRIAMVLPTTRKRIFV